MIEFSESDEEILYTNSGITKVDDKDIDFLKDKASGNKRKRIRLCAHLDINDSLHEMLIVQCMGNYIPPHKHPGKSESFHIIEGALEVVLFFDDGRIREVISMGQPHNNKSFYYRLSKSMFHTVLPTSEIVVFHETTNGPFRREDLVLAKWAPHEDDPYELRRQYMKDLKIMIEKNVEVKLTRMR